MSRIIMLVPLDEDISLTTITLSLIHLIDKKNKDNYFESFFYFSLIDNLIDKTKFIINKYFLKNIVLLDNINFLDQSLHSIKYYTLLNQVIDQCYKKKDINGIILIQGINKKQHVNADKINYEVSQNINAEVILIGHLKEFSFNYFNKKENNIKIFLEDVKYKNILGFIFNNICSPFIQKKYNFIEKLNILFHYETIKNSLQIKKNNFFKNKVFSLSDYIPWNKNLLQPSIMEISKFLNAKIINTHIENNKIIKKIIIFDGNYIDLIKKNYDCSLFLVSLNCIEIFINTLFIKSKINNISGIILTNASKFTSSILYSIEYLKNTNIPIFSLNINTIETLSKLQKFNFNIILYNRSYVTRLVEYCSNYLKDISFNLFQNKRINYNKKYSPQAFCHLLKILSKKNIKRIILPEAYEPRILKAASIAHSLGIANCVLLGNAQKIYKIANEKCICLNKDIQIIEPDFIRDKYLSRLLKIRKNKGITEFSAMKQLQDNTVLATLILESNEVDGLVSGSINTTANTIRPALQIIKTNPIYSLVSSIFFMLFPEEVFIYGDCAINIDPNAEELAEIAIQSANSAKIFGIEPRIAMLSYSSGYSGSGLQVEKVRNATSIVKTKTPNLIVEGPIQYDAAISKKVSKLKTPNSAIEGSANIFIFPDLNSGNITYKAVQRSSRLICIGPMLQGLNKPVNDLSRGASIEDIIYTIAITSIQS